MKHFRKNWEEIKSNKRVIIHIPSLSYEEFQRMSFQQYQTFQNNQLYRILDVIDPNVIVIYVSPFEIDEDAISYIVKILQVR